MPSADRPNAVVSGPTLKEAYREVRRRFGSGAVILDTRTVQRRQELGLGLEKVVEVTVQTQESDRSRVSPRPADQVAPVFSRSSERGDMPDAIVCEIERITNLVEAITTTQAALLEPDPITDCGALGETLLAGGTAPATVHKLLTRFTGETGGDPADRVQVLEWLTRSLQASNCDWTGFFGCHAFLGRRNWGQTDLVYAVAAHLQRLGRKTLVLSVMPGDPGNIRRLQSEAARHGYDAAVMQKETQLQRSEEHLSRYEAVLVDMPDLDGSTLQPGSYLHAWLARNPGFHRHLTVPLDADLADLDDLPVLARSWNCDWVALTRIDRSRRKGKILDLQELLPLPISLTCTSEIDPDAVEIASSGKVLDLVLAAGAGHES